MFIVQVDSQLRPDPGDETATLLRVLIYKIDNGTFGGNVPSLPQWTGPPRTMVDVQVILFFSLLLSLLSAFLAMLGKQWINRYASTDMRGSAIERSQNRQRKLDGIVAWYFASVMESLPLMLQAALLLLSCALSRYLWDISLNVASVVIGVTSFGIVFYLFITIAGATSESCPYQTPASHILRHQWPMVGRVMRSINSTLRSTFKRSRVIQTVAELAEEYNPWWSRSQIIPFFMYLLLLVPLGFFIDFYRLWRAAIRGLFALLMGAHRSANAWLHDWHATLEQGFDQRVTPLRLRCVSWALQTSLDKPVRLTTLEYLQTMTELAGIDPILVKHCFDEFVRCVRFRNNKLVVMDGLEKLAAVSASCFFRTFYRLSAADPTSGVLIDLRRRANAALPPHPEFTDSPLDFTMAMMHVLIGPVRNNRNIQWHSYRPPSQEHIPFARYMAETARAEYEQTGRRKVPRWILRFALRSLSLDPPSPAPVIADCLTIIAIDLDCDVSNITIPGERCVKI